MSSGGPDRRPSLLLGALGVVYGDIGTSPLYALRQCFAGATVPLTPENVLGVLSLIFWSLVVVISIKYLAYVMRADNRGEGGILALLTLVDRPGDSHRRRFVVVGTGILGAAFLYGDGMITPAISVLSAVEGLGIVTPRLDPYVVPVAVAILVGLFRFQWRGTEAVGAVFGPVMLLWFGTLAALGMRWILEVPAVLAAVDPLHGLRFLTHSGRAGFSILAAVFLVVTGGEALYADMGHFGKRPIRRAWFAIVLPALVLNYFGQGALLIQQPSAAISPFYLMAPKALLQALVVLATAATVIASQAVISGAFSLSTQALQLGYCPRLQVRHTSPQEIGQVYVPSINWMLAVAAVGLVVGFGSSHALAGAYGVAVSTTMMITTILAHRCARQRWGWSVLVAGLVSTALLTIDVAFFAANLTKIRDGGWFPLVVAGLFSLIMTTWHRGRLLLAEELARNRVAEEPFLRDIARHPPLRAPGLAVFMDSQRTGIPGALLHNLKHNKVLHESVVLLTVVTDEMPRVPVEERLEREEFEPGFVRLVAHYGYMDTPKVPAILRQARDRGLKYEPMLTTFFLGRETLICTRRGGMARWRKHLFALMSRNAQRAHAHFGLPPNRVVEIGSEVTL